MSSSSLRLLTSSLRMRFSSVRTATFCISCLSSSFSLVNASMRLFRASISVAFSFAASAFSSCALACAAAISPAVSWSSPRDDHSAIHMDSCGCYILTSDTGNGKVPRFGPLLSEGVVFLRPPLSKVCNSFNSMLTSSSSVIEPKRG